MEYILGQGQPCLVVPKTFKTYYPSMHERQKSALPLCLLLAVSTGRGRKLKNDDGISIC